jgi:hypothetical protein
MPEQEYRSMQVRTSITPSQAREFLTRAAREDDFRQRLEERPVETLSEYGIELSMDVVGAACRVPSRDQCEMLLERVAEVEEYAEADYMPIALAKVVLTVGYAMPLVATTGLALAERSSHARELH